MAPMPLKLYKVLVELDQPRKVLGMKTGTLYNVIVLAVGANSAHVVSLDSLTRQYGVSGYVRNVVEVTGFKENMILASHAIPLKQNT